MDEGCKVVISFFSKIDIKNEMKVDTVSSVESDTITTYRSQTLSSGTASSGDRWFGSVEELGQFLGC